LISIHADNHQQGELMGISESINSFAMALVPVFAATIYGVIGYQLYYLITVMPLIALFVALIGYKAKRG
jgi:hypothetical protein